MAEKTKNPKPVHHASSPFRPPDVPQLGQPYHDVVSELLINLLSAIGHHHRRTLPKNSKQRRVKRKRRSPRTASDQASKVVKPSESCKEHTTDASPPAIKDFCLLGFNAVTRHLEHLSRFSSKQHTSQEAKPHHISSVFLLRPMDDLIYSHLPSLCQTASLAHPDLPPTRLILLDPSVEPKITEAVAQVRGVSVLALVDDLDDVSGTKALTEYIRENVRAVEVPWLKQIADGQWLGTAIEVK